MNDDIGSNNIQKQDLVGGMSNDIANYAGQNNTPGPMAPPSIFQPTQSSIDNVTQATDNLAIDTVNSSGQSQTVAPISKFAQTTAQPNDIVPSGVPNPEQNEIQTIKHQALQELGPLVKHIDQEPEERFETLLMMIRASDDVDLIKPAYEAAQAIEDEQKKAKALLNVINEINYLTRPQDNNETQQQ